MVPHFLSPRGLVSVSGTSFRASQPNPVDGMVAFLRNHMSIYGYQPIDLPIIEDADLFLIKAGDHIIQKLFTFERHGQQLALRPEFTAAAAYHYIAENLTTVVRWQFSGPVFEYETLDGNNFQHASIGAELIGKSGTSADAEIIEMSAKGLSAQGIQDWQISIGHTGLIRHMLGRFQLDTRTQHLLLRHLGDLKDATRGKTWVLKEIEKAFGTPPENEGEASQANNETPSFNQILETIPTGLAMGGRSREDIARRLFEKRQLKASYKQVIAAIDLLEQLSQMSGTPDEVFPQLQKLMMTENPASQADLHYLTEVINLLEAAHIPKTSILIQPALARNWDYYTGIVFELRCNGSHVGGGGRYDELSRLIGGAKEIPAVGFAYYPESLAAALPTAQKNEHKSYSLLVNGKSLLNGNRWASLLREQRIPVILTEDEPADTNLTLAMQDNNTIRFHDQTYTLNDLNTLVARLA